MTEKVEAQGKKIDKKEKMLEKLLSSDSVMDTSVAFVNDLSVQENMLPKDFFWVKSEKKSLLVDCGTPKTVVGAPWLNEVKKEYDLDEKDLVYTKVKERFRFGEGEAFQSNVQVEVPYTVKMKDQLKTIKVKAVSYTHLTLPTTPYV